MENNESSKTTQANNGNEQNSAKDNQYYVYLLADKSKPGGVFYVGKGKDGRVFQHVKNVKDRPKGEETESLKVKQKIFDIKNNLEHIILRSDLTEKEALEVEASVIDLLRSNKVKLCSDLCNKQAGKGSTERGYRQIDGNITFYDSYLSLKAMQSCLLLKVDAIQKDYKKVLHTTTYKLDKSKLATDYIFLVDNYHVFAVFESGKDSWKKLPNGQYKYQGHEITDKSVIKPFIGKRVPKCIQYNTYYFRLMTRTDIDTGKKQDIIDDKKKNNK